VAEETASKKKRKADNEAAEAAEAAAAAVSEATAAYAAAYAAAAASSAAAAAASEKASLQDRVGALQQKNEKLEEAMRKFKSTIAQQPTTPNRRAPKVRSEYGEQYKSRGAVRSTGVDTQTSGDEESESDWGGKEERELSDDDYNDMSKVLPKQQVVNCFVVQPYSSHAHCSFLLTDR
jgi:hypothetical protein